MLKQNSNIETPFETNNAPRLNRILTIVIYNWQHAPSKHIAIQQQTAEEAYELVLRHVGCSLPKRDVIDDRIIKEVRTGTATKGDNGFIEAPNVAGGRPELDSLPAPADTDHDGMPDAWEKKAGLDSSDAVDAAQDKDDDGYTNIEEYINGTDPAVFVDYKRTT